MARKLLLSLLTMVATAFTALADDATPLTFNWAHTVDGRTAAGDNNIEMCKSANGSVYVATTWGTADSDVNTGENVKTVNFDGETLKGLDGEAIEGSPYVGNSINRNLLLQKVNPEDGSIVWTLYTKKGDVEQTYTQLAATADDGLIIGFKTRAWVEEAGLDNLLEIVDGKGATTTIKDMNTSYSEYRYIIAKLSANGQIVWTRLINGYVHYKGEGDFTENTKNNFYVNDLCLDGSENIYLSGNFRTKLQFKKKDGSVETFTAVNVSGWNGDSQKDVGDLFLAKLDNNGYFEKILLGEGDASATYLDKMAFDNGNIYLDGRAACSSTYKLGSYAIENEWPAKPIMFIASVKAEDLSVNWLKVVPNESLAKSKSIHNEAAQFIDGKLYLSGGIQGSWKDYTNSTGMFKPYLLCVDPSTGDIVYGTVTNVAGIGKAVGAFVANDKLYQFGYSFTTGAILIPFDKSTFAKGNTVTLCTGGTVAICSTPVVVNNHVIFMNRAGVAKTYTNTIKYMGTDTSFSNLACWFSTYYCYDINDSATGIDNISEAKTGRFDVYTTSGILVKTASTLDEAKQGLAKGVYIIGGQKLIVE